MTAEALIDSLLALGVRVTWCGGSPSLRFPEGVNGRAVLAEAGEAMAEHRQAVIDALGEFDTCLECRGSVRVPRTLEERQELWSLCRATGGSIMCPAFTLTHPGNGGWEAEARRTHKPPKRRWKPQGGPQP